MGFFDFLSKKPSNNVGVNLKVKEIMTPNPIVVSGTATIAQIEEIFGKNRIWSIYVGDSDKYIGVITRNDLKFRGKNESKSSPAHSIMSNGVVSIDENADVEDAKTLLYNKKINGLAVMRNGKHCGIITRYDIKNKQPKSFDFSQEEITRIDPSSPPMSPPRNDGQTWTNDDIQLLRQSWGEGKSIEIVANLLERSPDALVHKLIDTGLIGYNDDNCDPKPERYGLSWSDQERAQLISEFNAGKSIPEIANIHQRNKNAILHFLVKFQIIDYHDRSILEKYIPNNVPPETNQLIRTLISELENNSNIDFRNSAATQLGSFHEPSVVNALIKCVKNDPRVRYRALSALRNIGDPLAIPILIERSKDRSVRIRLVSVNALGEIGDSNVVKHLKSHIKSKDYQNALKNGGNPEIIQAAREAIQKICSRQHVGDVQTDLPNDQSDTHVLSSIQEIDARIKKGLAREIVAKGELSFIFNCARHSHNDIRKNANWVIGNLALNGEAEQVVQDGAVPILLEALADPYEGARSSSAWALSALAEKGQAQYLVKTGVIQPLITGLKDSDNLVRGFSARALDKIAYAGCANDLITFNVVPLLVQNLEDYYDNVRKKSIWALWSIAVTGKTDIFGQDRVLKPLIKYVLDKDVDVRSGSLHLLGVLGRKGLSERIIIAGITSPLIKSLSSRSRRVRGAAAWALGEIDQGMTGDEFIQSGAIAELKKISDNSNKILIFDETHSSWVEKSIHEIVEDTLRILNRKIPTNQSLGNDFPDLLSPLYVKTSYIGGGGFARIFKAERKDGHYVAVKIPTLMNATTGKTFIKEIQNWTKLSHPNIVKVYDFNILPIPYFEMELCDGSLADQTKPIESKEASRILFNICEGLKFAHARKIIHRDLKPMNILLKNGVPKISDWGLSSLISESTTTTATSFTVYYAAPEQIGNKTKDERTDIWQLGVIFYELVTGVLPFSGDSMVEVMAAIASKNPTLPSLIYPSSNEVESMIMKCLEKNPSKRYLSVLDLQKDLALYLRISYVESLKRSVTANDLGVSAFYCGKVVMMSLSIGDMKSAYMYLLDLVHYSKDNVKVEAQELSEQLKIRIEMGVTEIPDELIQKAEILVHQISVGFRNQENQE